MTTLTWARRSPLLLLVTLFLSFFFIGIALAQQNGSRFLGTITFAKSGSATLKFDVPSLLVDDPNNLPVTTLLLEFGIDGSGAPIDPNLPNSVSFTLKQGAQTALSFPLSALPSNVAVLGNTKRISMSRPNSVAGPGFYTLNIVHAQGSGATENWELDISGLETEAPSVRTNAALFGPNNGFTGLVPTGLCGGQQTCPSVCPRFQSCQSIFAFPWWKYVDRLVAVRWPIPPPPCLSCPAPWEGPSPEGFERVMVSVAPYVRGGEPLGPGKAKDVALNIRGGQPVGELVDLRDGQYLQLIEFRKGEPPRVSATAAGVTSGEIVAGPQPSRAERTYRILTFVFGALLLLALAAVIYLAVRVARGPAVT